MLTPAEDLAIDLTLGGLARRLRRGDACTRRTARARLRRRGRAPQHPGGRAVAVRRHRDRQRRADRRRGDPRPSSRRAVAGATTAADAIAAIDAYFASPAAASSPPAYVGATDDLTPVDIGEGQRLDYGMRADEARDRRAAARPRHRGGGGRRRASPATWPSGWRCSARPASGCSPPRRGCSTCAPRSASCRSAVENAKASAHLRARDARARAGEDRRDRSAGGGLGLPAARGAARVDLHGDLAARRACASPTSCA